MASFRKLPSGRVYAEVCVNRIRKSKTFRTKKEAELWAADMTRQIETDPAGVSTRTFREALERYRDEVVPKKKGERRETLMLNKLLRHPMVEKKLVDLTPDDLGKWRDQRLGEVSGSTVNRDMNILSHCLHTARKEWGWTDKEYTKFVSRPKENPARTRLPSQAEVDAVCEMLGNDLNSVSGRVAHAARFAAETSLRCKEICDLVPEDLTGQVLKIKDGKTGFREVPVSPKAVELFNEIGGYFDLKPSQVDALWRKARDRAMIPDLHFHDLRAWALTRLSKTLSMQQLARVSGHKSLKILFEHYYRERAEDIASLL